MALPNITRETYRTIKKMSREEFIVWIASYGVEMYAQAVDDTTAADVLALHDHMGFGSKRLNQMLQHRKKTLESLHKRLITANEIFEGLKEENVTLDYGGKK